MTSKINKTKSKRFARGQRIHIRRLKQAARKERNISIQPALKI